MKWLNNCLNNIMLILSNSNRPDEKMKEIVDKITYPKKSKKEKFPCKNCIVKPAGKCTKLCDRVEMDNKIVMKLFLKYNACCDCGSEKMYEGPCGGAAQNVTCADCGHSFNIALPLFIERI